MFIYRPPQKTLEDYRAEAREQAEKLRQQEEATKAAQVKKEGEPAAKASERQ